MKLKLTLLIFFLTQGFLFSQTVNIAGNPYGGNPYATIADAISASNDGDVILISGIHTESITIAKSITLKGSNPLTDIIQANAAPNTATTRVVTLSSGSYNITIENLGIRHGNADSSNNGGGIFGDKVTGLITLNNLIINNNKTARNGGGLSFDGSNVNITDCTISNNTATLEGGGIMASPNTAAAINCNVNIKQSLINANTGRNGGGMWINGNNSASYKIDVIIENSTISNNITTSASSGLGGGAIYTTSPTGGGVTLSFIHVTTYNNSHAALTKSGLQFAGTNPTLFSIYNSIIVNTGDITRKSLNLANVTISNSINTIFGGLEGVVPAIITDSGNNNLTGQTATQAGISGGLIDNGGKTQVLTMDKDIAFKNYCSVSLPISISNIDQRGFLRDATPDAGAFEYYNIWNGTNNDFTDANNWSDGNPVSGGLVHIKSSAFMPTAATIDVSNIVMDSGTSFITTSTYAGNLVYNRNLATTNWYLIGSPVTNQDEDDFISDANFAYGTGSNRGFASYNTLNDNWTYYTGTPSANVLTSGIGYSVKKMTAENISFSGSMLTNDLTPITLTTTGNGFNLVSNPYPSFINSETMLDLTSNSESLASKTIWVWDQSTGVYDTKVSTEAFKIAPTQGFFVKSDGAAGTLSINEAFQSHEADTFSKSEEKTSILLQLSSGNDIRKARLYYVDGATKGFDNGFDGALFKGVQNPFAIYSHLASTEVGVDLQVQSVPKTDLENTIIPIGINAIAGKQITIEATITNLPEGLKVFLEDRATNTITRLDEANSSYKVTLNDALNGTGRFFLHTKASGVLSTDEVVLQNTSIYAINNNTLRVVGLPSGNANVKMYSILGKQVMQTSFSSTGMKEISLPKLSTGMYIVQVETAAGKLNKKIVLE
ncbi:T9SS type A sorting domain-containing protein [Polaribacter gangjinensis]|uniref:Secretion system C-terminal sorting domain-containing protein n=1 Tax=Polaribacter gangjinensis TaxID=574710 RepID=A0A2S7WDP3_9FLAO|nr:T9SS type A sorting domain-containing protein [Polaribacter gangjinensis]PQJ75735.1 hypothetical protein BTO13_11095 [Polaribacter gangjinensis]